MMAISIDQDSQMLTAMTAPRPSTAVITLTLPEQKNFILKNINSVSRTERIAVGRILLRGGAKMVECAEGSLCDLDTLSAGVITKAYEHLARILV